MRHRKWFGMLAGFVLLCFLIGLCGIRSDRPVDKSTLGKFSFQTGTADVNVRPADGSPMTAGNQKWIAASSDRGPDWEQIEPISFFNRPSPRTDARIRPDLLLVPGGESIGVKLNTRGVLVVGYHLVDSAEGQASPGESAGIHIGDVITKINGKQMVSIRDIRQVITDSRGGTPVRLTVLRQQTLLDKKLVPVRDRNNLHYQLGLYIRDSASGIGTMTFYDPKTSSYGALGHVISDRDTGQPIRIREGSIVRSTVQAIERGSEGKPGEKIAYFPDNALSIGSVDKNTPFGIYGHLQGNYGARSAGERKAIPIALADQVREGPAQILTVLDGNKVQAFDIKILNSVPQKYPATKGLVIKITDPRLLKATGGIIQGMSGSPIIQDGKLVGAVTHVFVSDPTSGYGVHIEWMLQEAGLAAYQKNHLKQAAG
ncbi:SpoIVB peptidase [Sporolactobacillus sp. CQH2019]|uniref:SpoIVB peptidase n=1 Tax=Sporolactobacillus sp. CQH2019 TaxID=3023512 RepID=UPI0023681F12|nr:SpoIVB peptidase [Sporolactobacillus sp. CQH2019]MDD9149310.1 SpoIVB peptidase [Sporolactobacillus sp. CQH2019]